MSSAAHRDVGTEGPAAIDLRAWDTRIRVVVARGAARAEAEAATTAWLDRVDRACSRFRLDSDLSRVNHAGGRTVEVDPVLAEALGVALSAAEATDGLVTPTIGEALCRAGYDRTFALIGGTRPSDLPQAALTGPPVPDGDVPDWRLVEVDVDASTVRVPAGCRLDLGATTKAWAADRLAAELAELTSHGVLVDLGGDVVAAGEAPLDGWLVHVVDGAVGSGQGPLVRLEDGALATSSTVVRRWSTSDRPGHHIVDPRTGQPADDLWRTVTVSAAACLDANVASTACIVLAADGPAWLEQVGLPARLVRRDGLVTYLNGWPADASFLSADGRVA